jgi:molybdopterin-containing oxidoreductase family membrane subunit
MATIAKPQQKPADLPWLVGLGVLALIGLAAWIVQLTQGFGVLGVSQAVAWGAYIGAFFLLAGTGAGLVVLAAAGDLGLLPDFQGRRRGLLIGAVACFIAAGFAILMDIGKPERVFNMLFSPNVGSMFVWDFWCLALSIILAAAYLYFGANGKWLPILAAIAALAVVLVEGWILSVTSGRALWHSALLPVVFLVEAGIASLSAVLLLRGELASARKWLAALLPTALLLTVVELVTVGYNGSPEAAASLAILTRGSLAVVYWGQIILGVIVPFALLVWMSSNRTAVIAAAVLAFLGVFAAKFALLVAGQAIPFMQAQASYAPSLVEWAGLAGMIGWAGLLYLLGKRYLPAKFGA